LLAVALAVAACDAQSVNYTIGAWLPGSPEAMLAELRPLFENYLNENVGSKQSPPVGFHLVPVDYSAETDSDSLIRQKKMDFLYTIAGGMSCVIVERGWAVIATRRVKINGEETGADGSIVYSLQSNNDIQNISDLKEKKLGAGFILDATSYQLGYQVLAEQGVHLLRDIGQLILYGSDFERQFEDVLSGRIDAGLVSSTWLAENHPAQQHLLRIHRQLQMSYEGEEFPFPTSTPLIPQYGLASSERVHWKLKSAVANALQQLDGSHPVAIAAKLEGFTGPGSYAEVETTQKTMKIIIRDSSTGELR